MKPGRWVADKEERYCTFCYDKFTFIRRKQ